MRRIVSKEMVVIAGLLAAPAIAGLETPEAKSPQCDPRLSHLKRFFAQHNSPLEGLSAEFLAAADENDLDYRLLPSISLVESSGGRVYRNNNVLGWDSCKQKFPSVGAGIHMVAARLANSKLYRDKNVSEILSTYNPRPAYSVRVKSVMETIGSATLN